MEKQQDLSLGYRELVDLIKQVDESYSTIRETMVSKLEAAGLKADILDNILPITKEEIETSDDTTVNDVYKPFLAKHAINNEWENFYLDKIEDNVAPPELIRSMMLEIKEYSLSLIQTKQEAQKLKDESKDVIGQYLDYMSSSKVKEDKKKKINNFKEKLNEVTDEVERSNIESQIKTMESALYFDFLFDRFNSLGDKEVKNILTGFFNYDKGSYVMKRYTSKLHLFGYKNDIHKYFFNIEENFLPEEYSVYNNLFLYIYMRIVSYADPYNKADMMFVHSLTGAMANLVYHKFDTTEEEKEFINVIEKVIDKFAEYDEKFEEENTTHKNHPVRLENERLHDQKRKDAIIEKINDMNLDIDVNYDEISADDLQVLYDKKVEELIEKQMEEKRRRREEEELEEDADDYDEEDEEDSDEELDEEEDESSWDEEDLDEFEESSELDYTSEEDSDENSEDEEEDLEEEN